MLNLLKKLKMEICLIGVNDVLFARWYNVPNWGDAINPILIEKISGKNVVYRSDSPFIKFIDKVLNRTHYIVVGSILEYADKNTIVWGAGFISEDGRLKTEPKKICAVRGPLTRKIVIGQHIDCPKVYGDPALLYSQFYKPKVRKEYELGIIPHYIDKECNWIKLIKEKYGDDVLVIDVEGEMNKFVDDIASCELIASSSLHGIIVSDAYGVPSTWVEFSKNVFGKGFKFRDYFLSVNRKIENPLIIKDNTNLSQIYDRFYDYEIQIDLEKLYESCPFRG